MRTFIIVLPTILLLASCSATGSNNSSTSWVETVNGGPERTGTSRLPNNPLGLSFSLTEADAEDQGFSSRENSALPNTTGLYVDTDPEGYWTRKEIRFDQSGLPWSLRASRFFQGERDGLNACMDDYRSTLAQISSNYPDLYETTIGPSGDPGIRRYSACEGSRPSTVPGGGRLGIGRCVNVWCARQETEAGRAFGAILSVTYTDSERRRMMNERQRDLEAQDRQRSAAQRGLPTDEF